MSLDIKHNDFIEIIDKNDNSVITRGRVMIMKHDPEKLISVDYRHFFSLRDNSIYEIKIIADTNDIIEFNEEKYNNVIYPYCEKVHSDNEYIFREHDINELDPEIAPLVYALNNAGYETTGSCCGHGETRAWIHISFKAFYSIKYLTNILETEEFKDKFILTTIKHIFDTADNEIRLCLQSIHKGKKAYKDILLLTDYIKQRTKIFNRRLNFSA